MSALTMPRLPQPPSSTALTPKAPDPRSVLMDPLAPLEARVEAARRLGATGAEAIARARYLPRALLDALPARRQGKPASWASVWDLVGAARFGGHALDDERALYDG